MLNFYLLSAVQIVLESLPVSSSGHLALLINALRAFHFDMCFFSDLNNSFLFKYWIHFLHVPTAFVIALFFFPRWGFLLMHGTRTWPIIIKLSLLTGLADLITALFYLFFHLFDVTIQLSLGFLITAFLLGSLRWVHYTKHRVFMWDTAIILGVIQGCALLPGISRFAAVFVGACWLGFSRRKAFEITWLLQWPLIVAASTRSLYYFVSQPLFASVITFNLILVLISATILAYFALMLVAFLVHSNRLWWFSVYMPIPFVVSLLIT